MIVITANQSKKNKQYKLKHLLSDIYTDKNYIKITDSDIILKKHWYSFKKEIISIRYFCTKIIPSVMTHIIEREQQYDYNIYNLLKDISDSNNDETYNEVRLVNTVYHYYNLLLSILTFNESQISRPELKEPSLYEIIHIDMKPKWVSEKENEINSIIKIMKKSLQKNKLFYLPDR